MPKIVRKRQNTVLRRKQIIETLRKIIIRYGSEHVTVQRLAKAIGVSGGAIYRHFKSKREILLFLIDDIEEDLIGGIEKSYPIQNPLELLGKISRDLLSSIEQKKGVSFLVIAEIISLGDKRLNRKISEVLDRFLGHIKQIISEGIKLGGDPGGYNRGYGCHDFFWHASGIGHNMVLGRFPFDVGDKIRIGVEYIPGSDQKERMMKSSGREIPGKEHKIWILSIAVCGIAA